jgi:DNA polymerase-3 subunit gamma/tau
MSHNHSPYKVLARTYRPKHFDDLVGQEVLVTTLRHAIESGRIAHAFVLTGIRGIGKTTTARIIARALNCIGKDGNSRETIDPCGVCSNCKAIDIDNHPDILEMDAASRTGVDDIREIIDNSRYVPVLARYKIFIIDEVHMLSRNAFNALLKTLEEPPSHVKFIFATTEIRKIPITILSRCQRFDLRRIDAPMLVEHLQKIAAKENISVEEPAMQQIARAAEGSVRDALSLLDQAIVYGSGIVTRATTDAMLGSLEDKAAEALFQAILAGNTNDVLERFRQFYASGVDPAQTLQELLERIYAASARQVAGRAEAKSAPMSYLNIAWQVTLQGLQEVRLAPNPVMAAEMILIRLCHISSLPSTDDLIKSIQNDDSIFSSAQKKTPDLGKSAEKIEIKKPESQEKPISSGVLPEKENSDIILENFSEIIELFRSNNELLLYFQLKQDAHVISLTENQIVIHFKGALSRKDATKDIKQFLDQLTGKNWQIISSKEPGLLSLLEFAEHKKQRDIIKTSNLPEVRSILLQFPGAKVISVEK